jgi:hypothetical protein
MKQTITDFNMLRQKAASEGQSKLFAFSLWAMAISSAFLLAFPILNILFPIGWYAAISVRGEMSNQDIVMMNFMFPFDTTICTIAGITIYAVNRFLMSKTKAVGLEPFILVHKKLAIGGLWLMVAGWLAVIMTMFSYFPSNLA